MLAKALGRRPNRTQAGAVAIVVVAVATLTLGVLTQGQPTASPQSSPIGSTGEATITPTGGPSPLSSAPPGGEWAAIELPPLEAEAELVPSAGDDAGIASDATFTLASLSGEPANAISARLEISPATTFTVEGSSDPAAVTITPATALEPGETYRFALRARAGSLADSWAFRVRGPVRVTSTIPGEATTSVPVRTGIEVTFDQEDVADMADHFSIRPAVKGTFERHGRTQVFVPAALSPATLYTVTVRKGLARTGTDLELESDLVFRFETEGPSEEQTRILFAREAIEIGPGEPLTVAIEAIRPWVGDTPLPAPGSARMRIYRIPSLAAASRALSDFLDAPRWTYYSDPVIPTTGLRLVADVNGPLTPLARDILALQVPMELDPGWYVLEIPGPRRSQAFLQVTPVSSWVSVLNDRTVVWVNDVVTHRALEGATVAVGSARPFATSDADGLAVGATPAALLPPIAGGDAAASTPVLQVTTASGDTVLVPFNVRGDSMAYRGEWWGNVGATGETYWSLLYTDRELYRSTDRIHAWGYLRSRDEGEVPARVELRLVASGADGDRDVASLEVHPGPDGAYTASLPVDDLPLDSYRVQAVVAGRVVASRWVQVTVVRKPAYELELQARPLAVIKGAPVTLTASATFFEGTPVGSLEVTVSGDEDASAQQLSTDSGGHASLTRDTTSVTTYVDWDWATVRPTGPEAADIWADARFVVFPSAYDLAVSGTLAASRLELTGKVSEVDLARVRRALETDSWDGAAAGAAVAGATVEVAITELVPTRRQTGVEYDFVEKTVRPVYDYSYTYRDVRTMTLTSAGDGKVEASIAVPNPDHTYRVFLRSLDTANRAREETIWISPDQPDTLGNGIQFVTDDDKPANETSYGIGDRISWRMVDDARDLPSGSSDRYLYVVAQRGLRAAVVTDTPRFRHTFADRDAPGIFIMGVRFNGTTYAPKAAAWANFDVSARKLNVAITADREHYRPGDTAALAIRTTDARGSPVAATVVLQAVDEKLYAMGGASVPRPLDELYSRVDSGIVRLTATHQVPSMTGPEGEGGDTTGGGGGDSDRTDFRDTLLVRELRTNASGLAATSIRLSDDLTSWHVTAGAVTRGLAAGVGELMIPVGLPFFVEVTVADSYQVADRPAIQVRAFGDALRAGDPVSFTVSSASLGLAATTVRGTAFQPVSVTLPALSLGTHGITARAVALNRRDENGNSLSDGVNRTFEVLASRLTASTTAYGSLGDGLPAMPVGADRATWTFVDTGRGRLLSLLSGLAETGGARLDRALAQSRARQLLVATFGLDPGSFSPTDFELDRYPVGTWSDGQGVSQAGVGLLPYASLDPWLAARAALLAPGAFPAGSLREAFNLVRDDPDLKRDLQIAALAGLAGLGDPVLADLLQAAKQPNLTLTERVYLALGFEAVGDDAHAAVIERDLLAAQGERLGSWVRLRQPRTADGADAAALLAVVAAGVGDPLATGLADYAWTHSATDAVNDLELVAYAERALARTAAGAASFAYTLDGRRSVVELGPGETFTLGLTAAQAASLSAESLSGRVGVAIQARVPVAASTLHQDSDLSLRRAVIAQPVASDRIVQVDLTARFGAGALDGCYDVTEVVPSGLAPLPIGRAETDDQGITWPFSVVGQEVRFCASNDRTTGRSARLRYLARVVNEGTFSWEPAVMQLASAPELLTMTPGITVTIGRR